MKKILLIINSLKCGGAERILLDIVKSMPSYEYDISILTFNNEIMFDDRLPENIHFVTVLNFGSRYSHYMRKSLSYLGALDLYYRSKIRKTVDYYDTIVSFLEGFPLRAHSYLLDRAQRHITFVHTDISKYSDSCNQFKNMESLIAAYNSVNQIIFVSSGALLGFDKKFGDRIKTKKTVLENGIDIDSIKRKASESHYGIDSFSVVTVGRVTEVKGFDLIPRIAKLFKDKGVNIHFTIVGDGGYMPRLKQLIKEVGVEDAITLAGFQSNPYPFIQSSDIYISTSITEGMPLSICEAMALGKPVVASPTVGAVTLLSDGTGLIVNRIPQEYVDTIMRLIENPALLKKYGDLSSQKAKMYGMQEYMKRFVELL